MTFSSLLKILPKDMAPLGLAFAIAFATGVTIADTVTVSASTSQPEVTAVAPISTAVAEQSADTEETVQAQREVRIVIADGSEEARRRAVLETLARGL
ncbi:MAG: hypothetical protein AAFX39_07020 [Pseudomonadota bacterium]